MLRPDGRHRGCRHTLFHRFDDVSIEIAVAAIGANPCRDIFEDEPAPAAITGDCDDFTLLRLVGIAELAVIDRIGHGDTFSQQDRRR
jgi:hypothetical protein